jgi:hypothetical protein
MPALDLFGQDFSKPKAEVVQKAEEKQAITASSFFGTAFNTAAENAKEVTEGSIVEKGISSALSFFGVEFNTNKPPPAVEPVTPTKAKPITVESLIPALIQTESGGNHKAINKITGATGITQVLPKVGAKPGYGVKPLQNQTEGEYIRFTTDYLKAMVKKFDGDVEKAVAAYNYGGVNVDKLVDKHGDSWKDKLPLETRNYLKKVMPALEVKRKETGLPSFFDPTTDYVANRKLPITDYKTLEKEGKLKNLSEASNQFLQDNAFKISTYDKKGSDVAGFVYPKKDRLYLGSDDANTAIHEGEHIRQDSPESLHDKNMEAMRNGKISPSKALFEYAKKNHRTTAVWEVFNSSNAFDDNSEFFANLQAFDKQDLKGKNWGDTAFYKKLEKDVGEKEARTMMTDALLTLARKGKH